MVPKKGVVKMASNNFPPNDKARREKSRDKGQCQRCGKKVGLPSQYRVAIRNGAVHKDKGAKPDQSHYCADCASKRVKEKERYLAAGGGSSSTGRKRGSTKKTAAKKTTARKRGATKKSSARKRTVKGKAKGKGKSKRSKAASSAEPF